MYVILLSIYLRPCIRFQPNCEKFVHHEIKIQRVEISSSWYFGERKFFEFLKNIQTIKKNRKKFKSLKTAIEFEPPSLMIAYYFVAHYLFI
jgi:hypothetical protein